MKKIVLLTVGLLLVFGLLFYLLVVFKILPHRYSTVEYDSILDIPNINESIDWGRYNWPREITEIRAWNGIAVARANDGLFYRFDESSGLLKKLSVPGLQEILNLAEIDGKPCALGIESGRKGYRLVCDSGFRSTVAKILKTAWPKAADRWWIEIRLPDNARADASHARLLTYKNDVAVLNTKHIFLRKTGIWEEFDVPPVPYVVGQLREKVEHIPLGIVALDERKIFISVNHGEWGGGFLQLNLPHGGGASWDLLDDWYAADELFRDRNNQLWAASSYIWTSIYSFDGVGWSGNRNREGDFRIEGPNWHNFAFLADNELAAQNIFSEIAVVGPGKETRRLVQFEQPEHPFQMAGLLVKDDGDIFLGVRFKGGIKARKTSNGYRFSHFEFENDKEEYLIGLAENKDEALLEKAVTGIEEMFSNRLLEECIDGGMKKVAGSLVKNGNFYDYRIGELDASRLPSDAIRKGDHGTLKLLLEKGFAIRGDVNIFKPLSDDMSKVLYDHLKLHQFSEEFLRHVFQYSNYMPLLELVLEKGLKAQTRVDGGYTLLHNEIIKGNVSGVAALIKAHADVNATGARMSGKIPANKNEPGVFGKSFFKSAPESILKSGPDKQWHYLANLNSIGRRELGYYQEPPITTAVLSSKADRVPRENQLKIIRLLLEAGADLSVKDDLGNTALYYAESDKDAEVVGMLKSYAKKRR